MKYDDLRLPVAGLALACALPAGLAAGTATRQDQTALAPRVNEGSRMLRFDWPMLRIGTAEYAEGPTGVTVIHFQQRSSVAVDVRGGGPGTVNTDYARIGYDIPELDAVVFSGGSFYGLENTTAVNTALKDDGIRDGNWDNIGFTVGAIIYDFGDRRLNEIYPDKRLAQAALRAARPGTFPLGAQGAGRMAKSGGLFGCNAYSGQGGAFRQVGEIKIAAFVVVNAVGVVTTRDGRVAACYPDPKWPGEALRTNDLLAGYPKTRLEGFATAPAVDDKKRNTTVSLVVTNVKLPRAQLERLATQVHGSMSRGLQPFATEFDGDVLYAVSTNEVDHPLYETGKTTNFDLDVLASELMWDAILSSVPEQVTAPPPAAGPAPTAAELRRYAGEYVFSPYVTVRVTAEGDRLLAQATGKRRAFAIGLQAPVELLPAAKATFTVPGRYPLTLDFGTADRLVVNPGHWEQTGQRRKK
jgi:L-aminopeptidase/D-esterase-like protein